MVKQDFIKKLQAAFEESWSWATSAEPGLWHRENPAYGQCAASALVAQEYLGGWIVRVPYVDRGVGGSHYFNILEDGRRIDFTERQFTDDVSFDMPEAANDEALNKALIKGAIAYVIGKAGGIEVDDEQDIVRAYLLSNRNTSERYELLRSRVVASEAFQAKAPEKKARAADIRPAPAP